MPCLAQAFGCDFDDQGLDHLTPFQSKWSALVEHVFGFMENSMNGIFLQCIGLKRARCQIGLANLTYNICRYAQLVRLNRIECA
jgi:hypothetical protein